MKFNKNKTKNPRKNPKPKHWRDNWEGLCFKLQMNASLADGWVLEFDTTGMQVGVNYMGFLACITT